MARSAYALEGPHPTVSVVILSRDRPRLLQHSVESVLAQDFTGINLLVSDNSVSESVSLMLSEFFPSVRVIRRKPNLTAFDHFKTIIDEINTDFLVMFHDDDIMLKGYLSTLYRQLATRPTAVAVACDGYILSDGVCTGRRMANLESNVILSSPESLYRRYFSLNYDGAAPFPSYMYRTKLVKGLFLDPRHGGKFSDVSFLAKLLSRGEIHWLASPLIGYRVHEYNDSSTENIGHRLRLLRYVYTSTNLSRRSSEVLDYRYSYWIAWMKCAPRLNRSSWRLSSVKKFVRRYTFLLTMGRSAFRRRAMRSVWFHAKGRFSNMLRNHN